MVPDFAKSDFFGSAIARTCWLCRIGTDAIATERRARGVRETGDI
jgi:hypothetical protein